jgi:SAM-dependent methyltransferase
MQLYLRMRSAAVGRLIDQHGQRMNRRLRILEVGCGPGLTLRHVARSHEPRFLVGLDDEPVMLRRARETTDLAHHPVNLVRAAVPRLPFGDGSFDVVYATRFIHQFRDKAAVYAELSRVARADGLIILEFYRRPYHAVRFYAHSPDDDRTEFLTHSPSLSEVRAVVGASAEYVPLRLAGSRLWCALVGEHWTGWLAQRSWRRPWRVLVDEYLTVVDRSRGLSPQPSSVAVKTRRKRLSVPEPGG